MERNIEATRRFLMDSSCDGITMPQREYREKRPPDVLTIAQIVAEFGSWGEFVQSCGLRMCYSGGVIGGADDFSYSAEWLRDELKRNGSVTMRDYISASKHDDMLLSVSSIARHFGSWKAFFHHYGLEQRKRVKPVRAWKSEEEQAEIIAAMRANAHPAGSELQPLRIVGRWEPKRYYCWTRRCWYTCEAAAVSFE